MTRHPVGAVKCGAQHAADIVRSCGARRPEPGELVLNKLHKQRVERSTRREKLLDHDVERLMPSDHLGDGGCLPGRAAGVGRDFPVHGI